MTTHINVRGYVADIRLNGEGQGERIKGTKQAITYDVVWTEGLSGRMNNVAPHGRPEGPMDMEIHSAGVEWSVWGTVGPRGLVWHVQEQETTSDCNDSGNGDEPIPIELMGGGA